MTYTTVQGDMWDSIAYRLLGSCSRAGELMKHNRKYLNFYTFPAGIILTVPETETGVSGIDLPPWKRAVG